MRFVALFTITVAACGFPKLQPAGGTDDAHGGSGGSGNLCAASTPLRCDGNTLVSCNSDGTAEVQEACALRCNASPLACENKVAPSNGFAAQLDAAATEPYITITTNTSVDKIIDYNAAAGTVKVGSQLVKATVVPGTNGSPEVLVMSVGSLSVAAGVRLTFQNESGTMRAVAIMSAGDVSIAGTIYEAASGITTGNDPCTGVSSNAAGADNDVPGGGGGGFGTAGAKGAGILLVASAVNGGSATGDPTLVPLRGGCWGGATAYGGGGNGGGAIQISSGTKITIPAGGAIGAPGYGGYVNGGGGAGGGILLEAPVVTIAGGAYANGGSGGCGSFTQGTGTNGDLSTMPAIGGPCDNGQSGGNGAAGTTPPQDGPTLNNNAGVKQYAGGGGGAVGRIRVNTLDMTITGGGTFSPPASFGVIAGR